MEGLTLITAVNHWVLLERISLSLLKKIENVIHQPWSVRIGKNCALCLECGTQDLGQSFSNTDLPAGEHKHI